MVKRAIFDHLADSSLRRVLRFSAQRSLRSYKVGSCKRSLSVFCDAEAALRTAGGETSKAAVKHMLRRSAIVTHRYYQRMIALAHMPDATNVVDSHREWGPTHKS